MSDLVQTTSAFQALKLWALDVTPFSRDVLHLLAGLSILATTLVVRRSSIPSWACIAPTVAVALGAEALDWSDDISLWGAPRFGASAWDLLLTIGPALILLTLLIGRGRAKGLSRVQRCNEMKP